jgi:DNA-binding transcriptional MerR regulator
VIVDIEHGDEGLLGIGSFALATGLSIPRLRRYHELGLLVPAVVDGTSGYRRYTSDQIPAARRVAKLRRVDLPIGELAAALGDHDSRIVGVLDNHRRRLRERLAETQAMVDLVDQLIQEEHTTMSNPSLQLVEVVLFVEDVDATVAFYREVLGFEFQPDDHQGAAPTHYDACGGTWDPEGFFMFTVYPAGDRTPSQTSIGFGVPDVDAIWQRAETANATRLSAPSDSGYMPKSATIGDPAGNRVTVYQRAGDW